MAEGTIVRVITRLDETCREVRDAARVIGDAGLMKKMEEAQMKIKRDSEFHFFFCYFFLSLLLHDGTVVAGLFPWMTCMACDSIFTFLFSFPFRN